MEIAISTLVTDRALLLIGEPGTAKSWLSEHLTAAINGDSTKVIQGTAGTIYVFTDCGDILHPVGTGFFSAAINASISFWTVCKDLGVKRVKEKPDLMNWDLYNWLTILPGGKEAVMEPVQSASHSSRNI